jgi:hypothetical protein
LAKLLALSTDGRTKFSREGVALEFRREKLDAAGDLPGNRELAIQEMRRG